MHIQSVYLQGVKDINEDELLIGKDVFGVFDGATGLVPYINEHGETGGQIAAKLAKRLFASLDEPLETIAVKANKEIAKAMTKEGIDTSYPESRWSTTAAAVRLKGDWIEFVGIGDSCVLAILPRSYHPLLPYHNQDASLLNVWKFLNSEEKKAGLLRLRREANVTYGVLNGDQRAEKFLYAGKCKNVFDSVVIFTDGLLPPKRDALANEKWQEFAKLYRQGGLQNLAQYVRGQERVDASCEKFPRFKLHDDIAAVSLDFTASV